MLRPLDIVVLLKLSLENSERPPYLRLANELHLYPSEVYASVKRARASHFVQGPELGDRLNRSSLLEFLIWSSVCFSCGDRRADARGSNELCRSSTFENHC
jgi:hypothetical protein